MMADMGRPLQIRNVPEPVHDALKAKAEAAGMSLTAYALRVLEHDALRPSLEELLARVEQRKGGRVPLEGAARALETERSSRS
jgi:plasmid stability protein